MLRLWLSRGLLLAAGMTAFILSAGYRLGQVVPEDFLDATPETLPDPDGWKALDTHDWVRLAEQSEQSGDLDRAKADALRALSLDLTNGHAAAKLMTILSEQGHAAEAAQLAGLAGRLWTARSDAHVYLADYWQAQGKLDRMLEEWNILFIRDPAFRQALFPFLHMLATQPETAPLLDHYATQSPQWWPAFFSYLVREPSTPPATLSHLYGLTLKSGQPLRDTDIAQYVNRLIQENDWTAARNAWLDSLPTTVASLKGLLYDGGFEGERSPTGFDWTLAKHKQLAIKPEMTFGMEGQRALHITLNNAQHIPFQHVSQRLVLEPGTYELAYRARADRFRATAGLQWRVRCQQDNRVLAEAPAIHESFVWTGFTTAFTVPASDCPVQLLRLEAVSTRAHDQTFSGELWLDAMHIRPPSPPAK